MDGEKRELKNIPFTEITEKLKELNILDEESTRLDSILELFPEGVTTAAEFMALPPNRIMQVAAEMQNLGQPQPVGNVDGTAVAGLHGFDGIDYAMDDELNYGMISRPTVSVEEVQAKIDALKPSESVRIPFGLRGLRYANWHAHNGEMVINVDFDVVRHMYVHRKDAKVEDIYPKPEFLVIGKDKCVVIEGKSLKYYNSLKEVCQDYQSTDLEILYQKEKQREYRRRTSARIAELEAKIEAIWYSPGLPGAKAAHEHFEATKPQILPPE